MESGEKDIRELIRAYDPDGLAHIAYNLHRQIYDITGLSPEWPISHMAPENIILLGMGGSAIGGELLRSYLANSVKTPVIICRDYEIPAFVGPGTLCIAVSYSGNTEETLEAFEKCLKAGAKAIAVTSGGKISEMAQKNNGCICKIPGGFQPRAALGYLFSSLLIIMIRTGIYDGNIEHLKKTADFLKKTADDWKDCKAIHENLPLELASSLKDRIPVIYSGSGYLEAMAVRWKCQFNENSKMFASWACFPELNHNEIVGWGADKSLIDKMAVVILREPFESVKVKARIDLTAEYIRRMVPVYEIWPEGGDRLQRLFYLIMLGDLASIYLALLQKKDPSEINAIHWLKNELSKLDKSD